MDEKRKCKYCGLVHKHCPFTDCHNPEEPLPDSLEEGYMVKYGSCYDDEDGKDD